MVPNFKSFRSTVEGWLYDRFNPYLKLLVDPVTGAPMGIQSQNIAGPDGVWAPVQLTAAQIAAPTAAMVADLWAKYQLDAAPYTLYRSNGSELVPMGMDAADGSTFPGSVTQTVAGVSLTIGPRSYAVVYAPMHIQGTLHVQGRLDVIARPF